MSYSFSSMLKVFMIQCLLTMILAMPFKDASAATETIITKVNSYIYDGEEIDLKNELALTNLDKLKQLRLRVQGIENKAKLQVKVNQKTYNVKLKNKMKEIKINLKGIKVESLSVASEAAFLRTAKARVDIVVEEGDQPHPEDIGRTAYIALK